MADPRVGQEIANAWENVVGKKPQDNIHDDYWIFNRLSEGEGFKSIDGGRSINEPIEFGLNPTVRPYSGYEAIDLTQTDVFDEYQYTWKEYAGTVQMSELEKAKNQGEGRKFDLLGGKMENLRNTFKSVLNADFFGDGTGFGGKAVGGLQLLVPASPTTGTVGGINRATFSFWRSQQTSGAKTTTAFDNLRAAATSIYNLCSNGVSGQHPGFAVTTRTVFEGFESIHLQFDRYVRDSTSDKLISGYNSAAMMFKDIAVSYDNDCPTGTWYELNTRNLKLAYQAGYWMKAFPAVDPANQTVDVFKVMVILNLYTNNSRRLGCVTSIT